MGEVVYTGHQKENGESCLHRASEREWGSCLHRASEREWEKLSTPGLKGYFIVHISYLLTLITIMMVEVKPDER